MCYGVGRECRGEGHVVTVEPSLCTLFCDGALRQRPARCPRAYLTRRVPGLAPQVCLSAAILTKQGKVLLARQFVEMTRMKVRPLFCSAAALASGCVAGTLMVMALSEQAAA